MNHPMGPKYSCCMEKEGMSCMKFKTLLDASSCFENDGRIVKDCSNCIPLERKGTR
jgi:hypothetical protein